MIEVNAFWLGVFVGVVGTVVVEVALLAYIVYRGTKNGK